ncbi:hypothetical protein EVAR_89447_1 [Eumeta japonica]|uniref:Uncharacterized protein n=1 Tax=Eumeta variegata TaxID=151549 RepID=A0A4C1Z193_EUMVA|nr:hypothetical protein EVAR_89447_1 [Eumeta japonica]
MLVSLRRARQKTCYIRGCMTKRECARGGGAVPYVLAGLGEIELLTGKSSGFIIGTLDVVYGAGGDESNEVKVDGVSSSSPSSSPHQLFDITIH